MRSLRHLIVLVQLPLVATAGVAYGHHPLRPERNPLEFALFGALAAANVRTAIGAQALPNSLSKTPDAFGVVTAALIVAGSLVAMAGLAWRDPTTRLSIEQLGLGLAGFGLLCYGFALVNSGPWHDVAVAVSLSWGVSLGTGFRYAQIWWFFRQHGRA